MGNDSNTGLMEQAASSGVQQAGGNLAALAVSTVVNLVKKKYGETQIDLGAAFNRYLDNAYERYNHVKTLATGIQPREIIGEDSIYVSIGAQYKEKEVDTETVEPLLEISNHLVIEGTGGIGKSMLLRYLFLKTAMDGDYIPVLLTLRKINDQTADQIDLFQLIDTCMAEFDGQLPREQFVYSLRSGKYLFLLDGLDEVKEKLAGPTIKAIRDFCKKYPKNPCIITSRPQQNLMPLETFTLVQSDVLRKAQAIELASKLDPENEKTAEFCRQLEEDLFEKHKDFAENPLLLGMMFLTFARTNSIPDHLADFYSKTFDALYSLHDSTNKGTYQREFRCKNLDEPSFKKLLSYLCFHSYFRTHYEFSKDPIRNRNSDKYSIWDYIEEGIQKLRLSQVRAQDFIDDLCDAVCILVVEGDTYRFSHRSFQTYFAACYTDKLSDQVQKSIFKNLFQKDFSWVSHAEYFKILSQISVNRFFQNTLEDDLRTIHKAIESTPDPDTSLIKILCDAVFINRGSNSVSFGYRSLFLNARKTNYIRNVIFTFLGILKIGVIFYPDIQYFRGTLIPTLDSVLGTVKNVIDFDEVQSSNCVDDNDRSKIFSELAKICRVAEIRAAIAEWLQKADEERANLEKDDFFSSL